MSRRRHMQRAMGYDVPKHKRQRHKGKVLDNIPTLEVHVDPAKIKEGHVVDLVAGYDYNEGWLIRCSCGEEFEGTKDEKDTVERQAFDHVYSDGNEE